MRGLPGPYKLFWDFLYHDCDHAGVWIVDFDIAQTYVGSDMQISKAEALTLFNSDEVRIVEVNGGKKWFIPGFIEFQYGQLSEKNRAHTSAIQTLKKYGLLNDDLSLNYFSKPLTSPLQGGKDMDKDKEQEMDKDFGKYENLLGPRMISVFKEAYPKYPVDREVDLPACLQIAYKIAKSHGWKRESIVNGQMEEAVGVWREIVEFSQSDSWLSTRSISDFNKEYQRIIQKMNHGTARSKKQSTGVVGKDIEFDSI